MTHDAEKLDLRIRTIEDRLKRVEQLVGISIGPEKYENNGQQEENNKTQFENSSYSSETSQSKHQFSMNLLAILGVICFITASGFIIQLSIESRMLTPDIQIILSAALGAILIGVGLFMRRYDSKYSTYLPATGITVLFLTTLAAHLYHPVLYFQEALSGITLISGISIALYYKLKEEIYALVALIGTYLSPIALNIFEPSPDMVGFYCVFTVAFAYMGLLYKSKSIWLALTYLSVLSTSMMGTSIKAIDIYLLSALAFQFALCVVGIFMYLKKHNISLESINVWLYLPIILIFAGVEMYWISILKSSLLPWVGISFALMSVTLLLIVKHTLKASDNVQSLLLVTTIFGIIGSSFHNLFPKSVEVWALPIMILGYILSKKLLPPRTTSTHNPFAFPIFILRSIFIVNYVFLLINLPSWHYTTSNISLNILSAWRYANSNISLNTLSAMLVSSASLWAMVLLRKKLSPQLVKLESFLLGITHLVTIKTLYHSVEDFGSLAVSTIWLTYSIAVLILAFIKRDKSIAYSSILILLFAAGKALLYDASHAPTSLRIICLLVTGVVLFGAGYMMRRIAAWRVES